MKNPNANVVLAKRTNKANVPADLRSSVSVVRVVIGVKAKCKRSACFHIFLTLVVRVVKVVIGVKAKCKRSACEKNQQG